MSSFNYEFDYYTWDKHIICAEYISNNMTQSVIKAAIKYAIENNDYENYPDSDSYASVNTEDFNEIHGPDKKNDTGKKNDTVKKRKLNCFNFCFSKKKNNCIYYNGE
jgi:hypothetical protein